MRTPSLWPLLARCARLKPFRHYASLKTAGEARKLRNLGIIAHIDAGKTTTTERMLFFAGVTQRVGNVDSGDTVTDFLAAERERGITIQSAAITFDWHGHQVNLIDTPGHADFNFEVVRSLHVLDGAVTILDAVAGVEALTEKVWGLANGLNIPKLVFVNKMDRAGAGFSRTCREIVAKLQTRIALLTIPVFDKAKFLGIVDVVHQQRIIYLSPDGKQVEVTDVSETPQAEEARLARQALVDELSSVDEQVIEEFLASDCVSSETLVNSLKNATLANQITPVLCGASFRNIGVQPLLDAVVQYLPSPKTSLDDKSAATQMLAFKVRHDPLRGLLVYVRVYQGTLRKNFTVRNTTNGNSERISRLLRMQADEPVEISSVGAGDIAVLAGTSFIRTGDTLIAHPTKPNGVNSLPVSDQRRRLLPIPVPPPVFVTRISPRGAGDAREMHAALEILLREDPSLHLQFDDEANQYLLSGMGELHLEIATSRLVNELKARVDVGEVMITYKETLSGSLTHVGEKSRKNSSGSLTTVKVTVSRQENSVNSPSICELVDNNELLVKFKHPRIDFEAVANQCQIGITPVLAKGGAKGGYALFGLRFEVEVCMPLDVEDVHGIASLVRAATSSALAITDDQFLLLEPMMDVQVSCPQPKVGAVSTDLVATRRGLISALSSASTTESSATFQTLAQNTWLPTDHTMHLSKHQDQSVQLVQVQARVPLRKMVGYLSALRSLTQGRGTFEMSFCEFAEVAVQDVKEILEQS